MDKKSIKSLLTPHEELTLECGAVADVYPAGLVQIQEFSEHFATIASLLATTAKETSATSEQEKTRIAARNATIITRILPYVITHGLGLVEKCVTIRVGEETASLNDLPHWDIAAIAEKWVELTIGDDGKKLQPWAKLMGTVTSKIGKISSSQTSFSSSSPAGTP